MPYDLERFRGIFPAAMTMFAADGTLDEAATSRHREWLLDQGADGPVIAGTSGEFIALETEERLRLFRLAHHVVRGRVPVVAGSGHYSTQRTIATSRAAAENGADALIVILPYFQRPPKPAVLQHYREIRRAVDLPIMLYNNPANSACVELTPREIAALLEEDVLHMVKSTFESVVPIHELGALVGDRMAIFYGSFLAAFQGLASGAHGWISGVLNVVPGAAKALQAAIARNDAAHGLRIWQQIVPVVQLYTRQRIGGRERPRDLPGDARPVGTAWRLQPRAVLSVESGPTGKARDAAGGNRLERAAPRGMVRETKRSAMRPETRMILPCV